MKNRFFKLPIRFDAPRLVQDLDTCIQQNWSNHFNEKDYTGEWSGISLRSASGNAYDILSTPNTEGYADTALLKQCPYFQEIIELFACEKEAIRLLALTPGSHIKEHRDLGLAYEFGVFRLHIPIITDELVAFKVDGTNLKMDAGDCWYANFDLPHSVEHHGSVRRIHLVLDCQRNEWSDALFQEAGYDFEEEKQPQKHQQSVKIQMIESLELMNTDTARQLIAQLKKEIEEENAQNAQTVTASRALSLRGTKQTQEGVPTHFALGFAAYLLFMKAVKCEKEVYYGELNGHFYPIQDDKAAYFYELWQKLSVDELVATVLKNQNLWGVDLSVLPNFNDKILYFLNEMLKNGVFSTLDKQLVKNEQTILNSI